MIRIICTAVALLLTGCWQQPDPEVAGTRKAVGPLKAGRTPQDIIDQCENLTRT